MPDCYRSGVTAALSHSLVIHGGSAVPRRLPFLRLFALVLVALTASGAALVSTAGSPAAAVVGITGPDVSSFQHPNGVRIDWWKVKHNDRAFAIVKTTESTWYVNPWFGRDYAGAYSAGLVRGSYHFARPGYPLVSSALTQAAFYVKHLGTSLSQPRTLPPALDLEVDGGMSRGALITWAQTFLLAVRHATGRTPMIYTYPSFWSRTLGDAAALRRYPLWFAGYDGNYAPGTSLWQFTSAATVSGIAGRVDLSRWVSAPEDWTAVSDGMVATAWAPAAPGAPVNVHASPGSTTATVSWLPGDAGTSAITGYQVVVQPGGRAVTVDGQTTRATVTGLTNGAAYTFTVTARNGVGVGASSRPTAPVVPVAPTALTVTAPASLPYGQLIRVRAVLTRTDIGRPLVGAPVEVDVRPHGQGAWTPNALLTTDAGGAVSTALPSPTSIDVRIRYAGRSDIAPATAWRTVFVRTVVHRRLTARRSVPGRAVMLLGTIGPAVSGVTVWRQGFYGGRWHVLAITHTSPTGAFSFRIVPRARGTFVIRAVALSAAGRAPGYSQLARLYVT